MKKLILKILIFSLIAILALVGIFVTMGYFQYKDAVDEKSISNTIAEIQEGKNYIKIEDISEDFLNGIVAIEDHRFYSHSGIDILSTSHALFVNVKSKSFDYGASTITQQLGRLLYFTQERQVTRKIAELFVAIDLEKDYSKLDILELYVNIIYYGEGYYGIKQASKGYFDKEPSELTFDEATYLAGLPNAPSVYSVNEQLGEERRLQVVNAIEKYKEDLKQKPEN